jgi:hypothetical protein
MFLDSLFDPIALIALAGGPMKLYIDILYPNMILQYSPYLIALQIRHFRIGNHIYMEMIIIKLNIVTQDVWLQP